MRLEPTTLAQQSLPGSQAGRYSFPKPSSPGEAVAWAVVGLLLLAAIFFVIAKVRRDR